MRGSDDIGTLESPDKNNFGAGHSINSLRLITLKDPCKTANFATTAARLAGLLSDGKRMVIDVMVMTATVAIVLITEASVVTLKVYFNALI